MRNPFRSRDLSLQAEALNAARNQRDELQETLTRVIDERDELEMTNNRRSLRLHKQMETGDLQTPESRVSQLLVKERQLRDVSRLLSGESVGLDASLLREMGNRLGMGSPTAETIYARIAALQSLAPLRDKMRTALAGIDWDEDVDFEYEDDRAAVGVLLQLVR